MISNFPFLCDCSHSHLCQKTTKFIYHARPIMLTCCSLQLVGPIMFVVYAAYMVTQKIRQRLGFRQFSFIHYMSRCILYVVVTTFCCSTLKNHIFCTILNLWFQGGAPKRSWGQSRRPASGRWRTLIKNWTQRPISFKKLDLKSGKYILNSELQNTRDIFALSPVNQNYEIWQSTVQLFWVRQPILEFRSCCLLPCDPLDKQ